MKIIIHEKSTYILRFDPNEEVLKMLADFCEKEKITAGSFTAIGATKEVTLAYYDLPNKIYLDQKLEEDLEIVSVTGNVAIMNGKPAIHAHGTLSNRHLEVKGGHIKNMTISVTCEVTLHVFEGIIERKPNEKMGVNLLV